MSQWESEMGPESPWRFSWVGLLWVVIALAAFVTATPMGILIGLGALAYSIYLFRGGRHQIIIW